MRILVTTLFSLWFATPTIAEVILACSFPTLPSAVLRYPISPAVPTMEVDGRPAVEMVVRQGNDQLESAFVDGYTVQFSPSDFVISFEKGGKQLSSEVGNCIRIGGPTNDEPLLILTPEVEQSVAEDVEEPNVGAQADPANKGAWVISEEKSAFDDSRTVVVSLRSDQEIRGQFGGSGPAFLYLRCLENTTSAFITMNDLFLADIQGFGKVDYRIDTRKAQSKQMSASTDNKALGLWDGGASIPFIKSLLDGEKAAFRATPFNDSPTEFSFSLAGIDAASAPVREACKW